MARKARAEDEDWAIRRLIGKRAMVSGTLFHFHAATTEPRSSGDVSDVRITK